MYLSFNTFLLGLYFLILDYSVFIEFAILRFNSIAILIIILLDWISLIFIGFVLFISAVVIYYREEYIRDDKTLKRFILLVVLFVVSMILLVISPSLISILLGWDGLGLISYILVIYYQNSKSFNAGILTALINRVGDAALLISIAWISRYGRWNFIFYIDFFKKDGNILLISFFIILASITKSAQIPFSSWLPAAIAAPTPVSSLVHSSTLVTAGVYLLIRFNELFSPFIISILLYISLITIFIAGLAANLEYDLKKIIALSTLSQLGLIISILALGNEDLAFFHLLIHAFFKALLFICAGIVIHNLGDCQDIRNMGALVNSIPLTCILFNICNLSLCGLPFLSGFYSKDLVIEVISIRILNLFVYFIYYISVGLTACYRFRLTYYTLMGDYNLLTLNSLNENKIILKGIRGLVFFVIFKGRILMWILFPTPYFICLPLSIKILTLLIVISGIWIGYEGAKFNIRYTLNYFKFCNSRLFIVGIWNLPIFFTFRLVQYPLSLGKINLKFLDQGWFEFYGGQKLFITMNKISRVFQLVSRNHFKIFLIFIFIWILFITLFIFYLNSLF